MNHALPDKMPWEASVRYRAEGLLRSSDRGEIHLTQADRNRLDTIASIAEPSEGDRAFLDSFDELDDRYDD